MCLFYYGVACVVQYLLMFLFTHFILCLPFDTLITKTFTFSLSLLLFFLPFGFEKNTATAVYIVIHGVESSCRGRFMHCVDYLIHVSGKRQSAKFVDVTNLYHKYCSKFEQNTTQPFILIRF